MATQSPSRVLATGGAGMIGRQLADDQVRGLATVWPDFNPATEQR